MLGFDEHIAELAHGSGVGLALLVALLLGLRHATDPDHLTAVSTLVLSDAHRGTRRALALGLAWGGGHALTLLVLGVPLILYRHLLPEPLRTAAEVAVAVIIVALAVRLLLRWRRGYFHAHPHRHGELTHAHPHVHEGAAEHAHEHSAHDHAHAAELGRSPLAALGIGVVHGVGGSAGAGLLLVAAVPGQAAAVVALGVFAGATALSMGVCSAVLGHVLARGDVARRLVRLVPVFGVVAAAFGVWYGLGALESAPYFL